MGKIRVRQTDRMRTEGEEKYETNKQSPKVWEMGRDINTNRMNKTGESR